MFYAFLTLTKTLLEIIIHQEFDSCLVIKLYMSEEVKQPRTQYPVKEVGGQEDYYQNEYYFTSSVIE